MFLIPTKRPTDPRKRKHVQQEEKLKLDAARQSALPTKKKKSTLVNYINEMDPMQVDRHPTTNYIETNMCVVINLTFSFGF